MTAEPDFEALRARYEDDDEPVDNAAPAAAPPLPVRPVAPSADAHADEADEYDDDYYDEDDEDWGDDDDDVLDALDDLDARDGTAALAAGGSAALAAAGRRPNAHGGVANAQRLGTARIQPRGKAALADLGSRLNLGAAPTSRRSTSGGGYDDDDGHGHGARMSHAVAASVRAHEASGETGRSAVADKADRATTELVLDPRTRLVLFKMLHNGTLGEIHGCVSTGKEANVYHATAGAGHPPGGGGGGGGHAGPVAGGRRAKAAAAALAKAAESAAARAVARGENGGPESSSPTPTPTPAPPAPGHGGVSNRAAGGEDRGGFSLPAGWVGDVAVKIYKTSVLVFKDRDRYVAGDWRFRHGYCKSNPRKMVRLWAEKEHRNLMRLHSAGLPCPRPLLLRGHVLLMEFVGAGGWAAPKLKDAQLSPEQSGYAYAHLLSLVRSMYQTCRLVHGDLSEYNVLVRRCDASLVLIDVSQAVDLDHPRALDFLREDLAHVGAFFSKCGVAVLGARDAFDYVVGAVPSQWIAEGEGGQAPDGPSGPWMTSLLAAAAARTPQEAESVAASDAVFAGAYLPRTMDAVPHYERDAAGQGGPAPDAADVSQQIGGGNDDGSDSGTACSSDDDDDGGSGGSGADAGGDPNAAKAAQRAARRANNKAVKAQNAERRLAKTPKKARKRKQGGNKKS